MLNKLLQWDIIISEKLRLSEDQKVLRSIAAFLAHSGDSWYIELVLFVGWLLSHGTLRTFFAYLAGSVVIQALFVIAVKFLIKRQRPEGAWGDVYRKTDPHSFPSGHAARMVMLSVLAFGFGFLVLGWVIVFWGIAVSFARVAMGVHYLIDIFVGWIIGLLLAVAMLFFRPFFFNLLPFIF